MENSEAEIKDPKFGELLPSNVEDNPEPSQVVLEGVETRRDLCIKCGKTLTGRKNKKYCNEICRTRYIGLQYRIRHGLIEKPGVGSGGNQLLEKNHQYKDGIGCFRKIAFEYYDNKCNRCGKLNDLLVHHIDENRHNNKVENLEILCKKCHQDHHCHRCEDTGKYIKG